MIIILEAARARRKAGLVPPIREVCLVGDVSRRYAHTPFEGLRAEDSGLRSPAERARVGGPDRVRSPRP